MRASSRWPLRAVVCSCVLLGAAVSANAWASTSNLLANATFEGSGGGSLSGWTGVNSTLSLASDGVGGGFAGKASFVSTASYGIKSKPYPVNKSTVAGTVYSGNGQIRSDTPGKKACLRLFEVAPGGVTVAFAQTCVTTQTGWQAFPTVTYTSLGSGNSIAFRIVQSSGVSGNSFEVDNLSLTAGSSTTGPAAPTNLQVTNTTSSEVDLAWTASTSTNVVSYQVNRNGQPLQTIPSPGTTTVTYQDTAVQSSSSYTYTVQAKDSSGALSAPSNAVTASTSGTGGGGGVTIGAVGDMACNPSNSGWNGGNGLTSVCGQKRTSDRMLADTSLQFILGLGDYQYDCDEADAFAASYTPTWGRLNNLMRPVAGNHEYKTGSDTWSGEACPAGNTTAQPYFDYFGAAAHPESAGHFSFDVGSWHIIALNGNCNSSGSGGCSSTSPQTQWLQSDVDSTTQPCILAYWHQTRWTGTPTNQPAYSTWWNILYAAHTDLVVNAHIHNYFRFDQLDPSGNADPNGIREVIVGTGGEDLGGGSSTANPAPAVSIKGHFGYLRLTLASTSYTGAFIDAASGSTLDSFSGTCH